MVIVSKACDMTTDDLPVIKKLKKTDIQLMNHHSLVNFILNSMVRVSKSLVMTTVHREVAESGQKS